MFGVNNTLHVTTEMLSCVNTRKIHEMKGFICELGSHSETLWKTALLGNFPEFRAEFFFLKFLGGVLP